DPPVALRDHTVALLLRQPVHLPAAERVHARRGDVEPEHRSRRCDLEPQTPQLDIERRGRSTDPAAALEGRLLQLGPDLFAPIRGQDFTSSATEGTGSGVDELVLLLDTDRELVVHAVARVLRLHFPPSRFA